MVHLVADVGGTNTRLALASGGVVDPASIRRYANDAFDGFMPVVTRYLAEAGAPRVAGIAVALAGPTSPSGGRLTNRDWAFDVPMLRPVAGDGPVLYLNDLKAIAMAVPDMRPADSLPVVAARPGWAGNGQALVVGIGTGFNVSPVSRSRGRVHALDAEYGHTCLPRPVADMLSAGLGIGSDRFATVEACFSGRGFATVQAAGGDEAFYAGLIAALVRELVLAFMPLNGIYIAGGVARAVLDGPGGAVLADRMAQPFELNAALSHVPVALITNDYVPLTGCARHVAGSL